MADPFARVSAGAPVRGNLRADAWNAMLECASAFRRGKLGGPGASDPGTGITPAVEVLVRNDTGGDLDAGAVVGLGSSLVTIPDYAQDVRGRPAFAGTAPTAAGAFAVLTVPIKSGAIGPAVVSGVAVTKVSGSGDYAGPTASQTGYLAAAATGPVRVLQRATGSDPVTAVVLVGGPQPAAGFGAWPARITAGPDSNSRYSWQRIKDVAGTWSDDTTSTPNIGTLSAYPVPLAGGLWGVIPSGTDVLMWAAGTEYWFVPSPAASATVAGLVTTGGQTFAGAKTFQGVLTAGNGLGTSIIDCSGPIVGHSYIQGLSLNFGPGTPYSVGGYPYVASSGWSGSLSGTSYTVALGGGSFSGGRTFDLSSWNLKGASVDAGGYSCGGTSGISGTYTVPVGTGSTLHVTLTGGLITAWSVTTP